MVRAFILLLAGAFLLAAHGSSWGDPPMVRRTLLDSRIRQLTSLPTGKWKVEYSNGITEVCEFQKDGAATVVEPVRISGGKAVVNGASIVMVFDNGRVQRWTPVGQRLVVEHWYPGSQFPTVAADELGVAEGLP